ncbi:antitoxin Xre/MbcA/ParS toxin-binding domain-containing protein [Sodalis sp. RH16]|uniref:type II RES/Xre toxin-antitoxin system antitoxin n=1 Tax=unclassified Sodalis (in: enterobacteria) TaxID=2636512 RepID=UPI0039B52D15
MRAYIPSHEPQHNALWKFAGLPVSRGRELTNVLKIGLPVDVLDSIHKWSDMSKADILRIAGINERNVARRKSTGTAFSPDESERIARLVRVMDASVHLFGGNKPDAYTWLRSPVKGLGNVTPVSLLSTESGALEVLDLIGRLEHGVYS